MAMTAEEFMEQYGRDVRAVAATESGKRLLTALIRGTGFGKNSEAMSIRVASSLVGGAAPSIEMVNEKRRDYQNQQDFVKSNIIDFLDNSQRIAIMGDVFSVEVETATSLTLKKKGK